MYTKIVTNETSYAVTLAQLKDFLRIEGGDEDALLYNLLIAAHDLVATYTGRSLTTRTLRVYFDKWCNEFELPYSPVQSVSSVKYYDTAGNSATVDSSVYYLTPADTTAKVVKYSTSLWPTSIIRDQQGIEIEYIAGYGDDPNDVPFGIRQGVLHTAASMYENREVADIPQVAQKLLHPYRELIC